MNTVPMAACAVREAESPGRRYDEASHRYRGEFQRDRDRIIHARAFRRLENKTQVFTRRHSDHFRNRLTHTLEVAQISRTVAETVGLNADLVETLALAHDIGHAPFGHAGEGALNQSMQRVGESFDHNLQALRIVEDFEVRYAAFRGLNLMFEVREGIVKHSHDFALCQHSELKEYHLDLKPPIEAQIMDLTDEIAYLTADLDDGFEAQLLSLDQIETEVPVMARLLASVDSEYVGISPKLRFNEALRRLLDRLVSDLVQRLTLEIREFSCVDDVRHFPRRVAAFSQGVDLERRQLKDFLYRALYGHPQLKEENERAAQLVTELFECLIENPSRLPVAHGAKASHSSLPRVVCDYLAGMTDSYIVLQHRRLKSVV